MKKLYNYILLILILLDANAVLGIGSTYRFQGTLTNLTDDPVVGYISVKRTLNGVVSFETPNQINASGKFDFNYTLPNDDIIDKGEICLLYSIDATPLLPGSPWDHRKIFCLDLDNWKLNTFSVLATVVNKSSFLPSMSVMSMPSDNFRNWCGLKIQKPPNADIQGAFDVFYFDGTRTWCPDQHEKLSTISIQGFPNGNLVSNGSFEGKPSGYFDEGYIFSYPGWNSDKLKHFYGGYNNLFKSSNTIKPVSGTSMASIRLFTDNLHPPALTAESGYLKSDYFRVEPGKHYFVGFYVSRTKPPFFGPPIDEPPVVGVRPKISLYSSKTSPELPAAPDLTGPISYTPTLVDQWTYYSFEFSASPVANYARIELISPDLASASGTFFFDDVAIAQSDFGWAEGTQNALLGTSMVKYVNTSNLPIETRTKTGEWFDTYTQTEYDELLRPVKLSLPIAWDPNLETNAIGFVPDIFSKANSTYNGDNYYLGQGNAGIYPDAGGFAYSETRYESNPIGRPTVQSYPGAQWRLSMHNTHNSYGGSSNLDEPLINPPSNIDGTALYSYTQFMDPEDKPTRIFKDKFGRKKRMCFYNGTKWINTDFENDVNGNIIKQTSPDGPGGTKNSIKRIYNNVGMLLSEESPDFGRNSYIYDSKNRLRFSQTQIQRTDVPHRFSYSKFDDYDRVIESGEFLDDQFYTQAYADQQYFPQQNDKRTLTRTFNFYDNLPENKKYCQDVPGSFKIVVRSDANPQNPNEFTNLNSAYTYLQTYFSALPKFDGVLKIYQVFDTPAQMITPLVGTNFLPLSLSNPSSKIPFTIEGVLRNSAAFAKQIGGSYTFPVTWGDFRGRLAQTVTCNTDLIGEAVGLEQVSKIFNYDKYGRVVDEFEYNGYIKDELTKWDRTSYKYNKVGQLVEKYFYKNAFSTDLVSTFLYIYNLRGEMVQIDFLDTPNFWKMTAAQFYYNLDGSLSQKDLGLISDMDDYFQALHWYNEYNPRGWLVKSHSYGPPPGFQHIFLENLKYETGANPKYDGNISYYSTIDRDMTSNQWNYIYDGSNRLKNAVLSVNNSLTFQGFDYSYFDNGAINTVAKYGQLFTYHYETFLDQFTNQTLTSNRLRNVTYPGTALRDTRYINNFTYDASGRLRSDNSKRLSVDFGDNERPYFFGHYSGTNPDDNTDIMVYDGNGNRKSKISYFNGNWLTSTHYFGNGKEIKEISGSPTETFYPYESFGKRKMAATGLGNPEIRISDHLGSTVAVVDIMNNSVTYKAENEPYGKLKNEMVSTGSPVTQKFTGKEHDDGIDLDYFGARYYDADLGVWISPDPLRQYSSPYTYCGDNPISCIDPDGNAGGDANWAKADEIYHSQNPVGQAKAIATASGAGASLAVLGPLAPIAVPYAEAAMAWGVSGVAGLGTALYRGAQVGSVYLQQAELYVKSLSPWVRLGIGAAAAKATAEIEGPKGDIIRTIVAKTLISWTGNEGKLGDMTVTQKDQGAQPLYSAPPK